MAPPLAAKSDAVSRHFAVEELHCVVNGESRGDRATGRVDVKVNVLMPVFRLQIQQFHHDQVGRGIVDDAVQKHNTVFQEQVANAHLTLTSNVPPSRELRVARHLCKRIKHSESFLERMQVCAGGIAHYMAASQPCEKD
jgi:hypothetical protein